MSSTNDFPIFSDALYNRPEVEKDLEGFMEYAKGFADKMRDALTSGDPKVEVAVKRVVRDIQDGETIERAINNLPPKPEPPTRSMITNRPTWDQYGMQLATAAALRGDCVRRQVGAALMGADHSIISLGYNGGPSKGASCMAGECPRGRASKKEAPGDSAYDTGVGTCVALHAEWNVLIRTDWHRFTGSTLYVTHTPCHICKVMIAGTDIARVVAPSYEWKRGSL